MNRKLLVGLLAALAVLSLAPTAQAEEWASYCTYNGNRVVSCAFVVGEEGQCFYVQGKLANTAQCYQ